MGWSKTYEFNESDLRCGLDTIDVWIDSVAMGRNNLPPNKVPFAAIYTLLSECVYGGKIDNAFDRRLLNTFLRRLFVIESFDTNEFKLVSAALENNNDTSNSDESTSTAFSLPMPDAIKKEQFLEWIDEQLGRHTQTPSWLGLPNSAEKVLLVNNCRECVAKLLKLSIMEEDEDEFAYEADADKKRLDAPTNMSSRLSRAG